MFVFERGRGDIYLGTPGANEFALNAHHLVRRFNGTVYPTKDRSVVVKLTDRDGAVGWGETYGLVAPKAVAAIVDDLLGPYLKTLAPSTPDTAWDALYDLQRVRGYWGGYLADTLAALDIALWDLYARARGESLQAALGRAGAGALPAYVSGLPLKTTAERVDLAARWKDRGFDCLKLPLSATEDGDAPREFAALRDRLGDDHKIALDVHWTKDVAGMLALDRDLAPYDPWFLEAPVKPEDIAAQVEIARAVKAPMALGEEWRTEWDYIPRAGACTIVQPEMGHTGVTQFMRIARRAEAISSRIMPHATIGLGIFMSASLRAAHAAGAESHEYQHTIYDRNAELLDGAAPCANGAFQIPDTPGHGVVPNADGLAHLTELKL
ncbi:mandelate racemase/muconate lactonizing enzyme family protein [Bauldia sp.]|uniref:mandelate racemase/muconate lactonizing enzyme family protein n=1 Tax=Bauldia sp. TaxID=2575872 RepID=UPI003BAC5D80